MNFNLKIVSIEGACGHKTLVAIMNVRYLAANPDFLNNISGEDLAPFLPLLFIVSIVVDDLNTIHQLCAFEEALTDAGSEWCQFLDQESLEVIQYMNDLKVSTELS